MEDNLLTIMLCFKDPLMQIMQYFTEEYHFMHLIIFEHFMQNFDDYYYYYYCYYYFIVVVIDLID